MVNRTNIVLQGLANAARVGCGEPDQRHMGEPPHHLLANHVAQLDIREMRDEQRHEVQHEPRHKGGDEHHDPVVDGITVNGISGVGGRQEHGTDAD